MKKNNTKDKIKDTKVHEGNNNCKKTNWEKITLMSCRVYAKNPHQLKKRCFGQRTPSIRFVTWKILAMFHSVQALWAQAGVLTCKRLNM
jgi:hypothetical protein